MQKNNSRFLIAGTQKIGENILITQFLFEFFYFVLDQYKFTIILQFITLCSAWIIFFNINNSQINFCIKRCIISTGLTSAGPISRVVITTGLISTGPISRVVITTGLISTGPIS